MAGKKKRKNTLSTCQATIRAKETHTEVGEDGMESGDREPSRWSVVRMCCDRCGARWPGLRFEVICLRSMAGDVTKESINGQFRKKRRRRTYEDRSSLLLLLKLLKGRSSFKLAAYVIFELRSDQTRCLGPSHLIPPYIPTYPGSAETPSISFVINVACYRTELL